MLGGLIVLTSLIHMMNINIWSSNYRRLHRLDYNGDGKQDILLQGNNAYHDSFL